MNKKIFAAGSIAVALTMVGLFSTAATAATTPPPSDVTPAEYVKLLEQGLVEPTGGTLTLQQDAKGQVGTQATAPISSDGTFRVSSSSSGQSVYNSFASDISIGNSYTFARVDSGSTLSTFTGPGSGTVTSDTKFWATGLAITASAPASAGFSIGTAEATYTGNASDVYTTTTEYGGLEFAGPLFTVNQNVTSTWNVGGNTYILTTN
jgi:hypothetical protein